MTRTLFLISTLVCCFLLIGNTPALFAQKKRKSNDTELSESRLREAEFYFVEAEKYYILEDYTKALQYFQRVAELNPSSATVHYKIAEIFSKSNREDDLIKASISVDNALKLEKKNKYFYLLASNIHSNLTNFAKAAQYLETMMKEVKDTEEYLYQLAAIYQYDNKEDEAIKTYNRAESILGINEISSLQKQQIYLEQGKLKEAIVEGERLIEAFPDEEEYVMAFAEMLARQKELTKAIEVLENYITSHPESGSSKMLLAGLYRDSGQEEKARAYIQEVFDDPSIDVSSKVIVVGTYAATLSQQNNAGNDVTELKKFTMDLFQRLKKAYPNEPNVDIVGGDLYLGLGEKEKARSNYASAIRNGSTSFEAWQNLLFLESEMDEIDSIIVHSEEGLEIFPNQAMLYYFNGYAHTRKRHYHEAVYSLEQAKRLSGTNPGLVNEINGLLGDTYNGLKEYAKSDQAYEEALQFNPSNAFILNNYSYYLALRKENLEKAEKMSALAVKNNPDNNSYLDTYAWVLFTRGKYREAKKVMEKVIETKPTNSVFFEHYGDILFKLGNIDEAVEQWEKAKSLDGDNELIDKKIANRKLY